MVHMLSKIRNQYLIQCIVILANANLHLTTIVCLIMKQKMWCEAAIVDSITIYTTMRVGKLL